MEGWVTRVRVRVMWVTIWYITMNYLPKRDSASSLTRATSKLNRSLQ